MDWNTSAVYVRHFRGQMAVFPTLEHAVFWLAVDADVKPGDKITVTVVIGGQGVTNNWYGTCADVMHAIHQEIPAAYTMVREHEQTVKPLAVRQAEETACMAMAGMGEYWR